jgi:hypothetical protein
MIGHTTSASERERARRDLTTGTDGGTDVAYADISPNAHTAEYDLLEIIAEPEGREIECSYAGYRITVSQDGAVKLVPVKETIDG